MKFVRKKEMIMDEKEMNGMDNMDADTIIFEDDDGNEYEFAVRDYFFYNGAEYALLTEVGQEADENGEECIVCKVKTSEGADGEEEEEFVLVEDETLAEKLIEIANTRIADDEEI
jgi:uncharacterized protein YrzB (UPF0473 family)